MIETFTRCAPPDFMPNRVVKSAVRPFRVLGSNNPHFFFVKGKTVNVNGEPVAWTDVSIVKSMPRNGKFWINHYFTKSKQEWEQKIARGNPAFLRSADEFDIYDKASTVDDTTAFALAPSVHDILTNLEHVNKNPYRAEQSRAEQSRAEQSRAELSFFYFLFISIFSLCWSWRALGLQVTLRKLIGRVKIRFVLLTKRFLPRFL